MQSIPSDAINIDGKKKQRKNERALHIEHFDATLIGTTTADTNGDWSVEVSSLSDGVHSIFAISVDDADNESNPSTSISYEVESHRQKIPPMDVAI